MFGIVTLVAFAILAGDVPHRARLRQELEATWDRENERFLRELRTSR